MKLLIRNLVITSCSLALLLAAVAPSRAAVPADKFLPTSTVGFVSIPRPADFEERFNSTDLGKLVADPSMEPFTEQVKSQLARRLGDLEGRVGITIEDLRGVASGELALALLPAASGPATTVLTVDTKGNAASRDALVEKIVAHLEKENAKHSTIDGDTTIEVYDIPAKGDKPPRTAAWFVRDEQLVLTSSAAVAEEMLAAVAAPPANPLAKNAGYTYARQKVSAQAGGVPADLTWYIDPFAYADAARTIAEYEGRTRDDEEEESDLLREQGFDAVKAIGGDLFVAIDEQNDFVHRTAIYAPTDPTAEKGNKYRLAMEMLKLPNREGMNVESWVPRMIASYSTANIDILNAFDNVASIFDAIAGYPDAFKNTIENFEKDPFGPKIKFRDEIVKSLGSRVVLINDYLLPITPQSERFLVAIEVKPGMEDTLRPAIDRYMESDGYKKIKIDDREVWEYQPDESLASGYSSDSLLPGIGPQPEEKEEDERLLIRSAVAVTKTYLLIASDVELLRQAFRQERQATEALDQSFDFQDVMTSLDKFGTKTRSSWSFYRSDERIRPGYELLRTGRMPESETFVGRVLNELLTSSEEENDRILRKQRFEADQLPSFELTRRYFGPGGQTVRSDENGWLISGVLLKK